MIKYIYSATGEKLRTIHYTAPANIHVDVECDYEDIEHNYLAVDSTDYLCGGSVIYVNAIPSKIFFDGGYLDINVVKGKQTQRPRRTAGMTDEEYSALLQRWMHTLSRTELNYMFYTKDHLGNNRAVIDKSGTVRQKTDYYPSGTPFSTRAYTITSGFQPFKYNGKEFDMMHGLNTYDYGARQYYPLFAQWDRVDPLCEKYYNVSPYAYCLNNPINYIDMDGLYPKGVLVHHKTSFYRADYYTFTKPAAHIISLVTGIKEDYIRTVNVMEKGIGREYPLYDPNIGGGAITLGSDPNNVTMTFTKNFFADDANDYNGNGYGKNVFEWLNLVSHEATHIKHVEQAGGKAKYLMHFLTQYIKYGDHDKVPEEKEANKNRDKFNSFNSYINSNYEKNGLQELFNSDMSDRQKIRQIDQWWNEFQKYNNR